MAFAHLSSDQLAYWLEMKPGEINIIDIRDKASYNQGHIVSAVHIDNNTVGAFIDANEKTKPLIVCCYHGNSSQGAANYMSEQGYTDTYSLDGGFEEWRAKPFFNTTTESSSE